MSTESQDQKQRDSRTCTDKPDFTSTNETPKQVLKENKVKWVNKKDILSVIPILISSIALVMTIKGFNRTVRAIEISEENLKDLRKKDSIVQKQFATMNNAYFQIAKFDFISFDADSIVYFKYFVENLGSQPAILLKRKVGIKASTRNPDSTLDLEKVTIIDPVNLYVREKPAELIFMTDVPLPKNVYNDLLTRARFLYIYGEFLYKNVVTGSYGVYKFCYAINMSTIKSDKKAAMYVVYNDNNDFANLADFDK